MWRERLIATTFCYTKPHVFFPQCHFTAGRRRPGGVALAQASTLTCEARLQRAHTGHASRRAAPGRPQLPKAPLKAEGI